MGPDCSWDLIHCEECQDLSHSNSCFQIHSKCYSTHPLSRGDNTRNVFLRELYLHYAMVNVHYVNILAFLAKQLSRFAKFTMRDIVIGGWLPHNGTHGCCFWWGHQAPDYGTLTMWFRVTFKHGDYLLRWWNIWPNSSLRNGLYLPRRKIRIWVTKNRLYTVGNPSEEESEEDGFPSYEINHACSVKDKGETQPPTNQKNGKSSQYQDH